MANHQIRKQDKHDHNLRQEPIGHWAAAHAKGNGGGIKDFLRSNLFTALVIFLLTQGLLVGGSIAGMFWRTTTLSEWKGKTDAKVEEMENKGTSYSRNKHEQHEKELSAIRARMDKVEEETKHLDVFEAENRRITAELEKLKNERK